MKYPWLFATLYTANQVGINAWRTPTMNFSVVPWSMIAWSTNLCQAIIFNPTVLSLPLRFQGSFQLYIRIDDIDPVGSPERVADIYIPKNLSPSSPLNRMYYPDDTSNPRIELGFQVDCDRNFYSSDCSVFCQLTDDSTGHYDCGPNGEIICLSGWTNPPTCLTGKLI